MTERNESLDGRIVATYKAALAASHGGPRVEIHIGQDVWDYMRSLADHDAKDRLGDRLFGFDLFLEAAWEPDRIEVWTKEVIW